MGKAKPGARCAVFTAMLLALSACAPTISRIGLENRIATGTAPPILDVRSEAEYLESHVPGAVHVPFYAVIPRRRELPVREGEPLVVYCEHGPRARLARVGLWIAGAGPVQFLDGHMSGWRDSMADNTRTLVLGGPPADEEACLAEGGSWGRHGLLQVDRCDLPTGDAGRPCTSSTQCESVCVTGHGVATGSEQTGRCFASSVTLGTCLNRVEEGRATGRICED